MMCNIPWNFFFFKNLQAITFEIILASTLIREISLQFLMGVLSYVALLEF